MFCSHCGAQIADGSQFCPNCGKTMTQGSGADGAQNGAPIDFTQNYSADPMAGVNNEEGKPLAIASLVLGIIAVVCCFTGIGSIVAIICGIIGIVLAGKSKNRGYFGGMRTAGFVLSIIGLVLGVLIFILVIAAMVIAGSFMTSLGGLDGLEELRNLNFDGLDI